jgi:hypothetical protein
MNRLSGNCFIYFALLLLLFGREIARPNCFSFALGQNECNIEAKGAYRYITSNGIPDHSTGQFPNRGNPNSISAQNYHFRVPLKPQTADHDYRGYMFGVAINGIPFDPGTAELWNGDRRWHYEALTGFLSSRGSLGVDRNYAHVQPNGAYHYHGLPMGLLERLNYTRKMALVGYAADGYPIYGPYAYTDAGNAHSGLKVLKSSYRLKEGSRDSGSDGPGGVFDGSFAQDYEYQKGLGDLDQYNGRFGITPEYPGGTFYYVLTDTWPFVPRQFRGSPDSSFRKGPPGQGGASGGYRPGFGPPPGFRSSEGFGRGKVPSRGFDPDGGPPGGFAPPRFPDNNANGMR